MEKYPPQKNAEEKYIDPLIFIKIKKSAIYLGIFSIALLLYNFDALIGYFRYLNLCKTESGIKYYEQAEKDVGWESENSGVSNYEPVFKFIHISFVRYENEKGEIFDVTRTPLVDPRWDKSYLYNFNPVDKSKEVRYFYRYSFDNSFEGDDRFHKTQYRVIDLKKNKIVFDYTKFWYEWSKADIFMLVNGSGISCPPPLSSDTWRSLFINIFQPRSQ